MYILYLFVKIHIKLKNIDWCTLLKVTPGVT